MKFVLLYNFNIYFKKKHVTVYVTGINHVILAAYFNYTLLLLKQNHCYKEKISSL